MRTVPERCVRQKQPPSRAADGPRGRRLYGGGRSTLPTASVAEYSVVDRFSSAVPASPALGRLIVDLDALVSNYRSLCRLAPGRTVAAVVKADAYGLGAEAVSMALAAAGCETYFVATVDEALGLRARLPAAVIYSLGGVPGDSAPQLAAARIRPVLNSLSDASKWAAVGREHPAALQIDTGLTRSGFDADELGELLAVPGLPARLNLALLLTHYACADEPERPENRRQLEAMGVLAAAVGPLPTSIANSSGVLLGPDFQGDVVRPGLALYGGIANPGSAFALREVVRLEARVLQRRRVATARRVGYGAAAEVPAGTTLAVLGVGYADGYPRSLGDGVGSALVDGRPAPVVGRVSMDLTVIDVSRLPATAAAEGDYVTLLGGGLALEDVARAAGTIGYELLTGIGGRVRREYRPVR